MVNRNPIICLEYKIVSPYGMIPKGRNINLLSIR